MVDLTNVSVNPLEQFVLLAKNARGAAAVELIKQALEAPAVFVFGELLDMPNIQVIFPNPVQNSASPFLSVSCVLNLPPFCLLFLSIRSSRSCSCNPRVFPSQ